ncbi:Uncharacterised protein [Edwardsiella ictaluri]|nr:Uncharacterised protein [Edwardsiella ictaluri]
MISWRTIRFSSRTPRPSAISKRPSALRALPAQPVTYGFYPSFPSAANSAALCDTRAMRGKM